MHFRFTAHYPASNFNYPQEKTTLPADDLEEAGGKCCVRRLSN